VRVAYRRAVAEDEEESSFVSMTDMTVSFLFIVIILLAFFASRYSGEEDVPRSHLVDMRLQRDAALETVESLRQALRAAFDKAEAAEAIVENRDPLESYMKLAGAMRLRLLEQLRDEIRQDYPDLAIGISPGGDALRFQGEGLFRTGEASLRARQREIVQNVAEKLDKALPCYTFGPNRAWSEACNPEFAVIEAVQIEGHTDSQGAELRNLSLSTDRANTTFASMVDRQSDLKQHLNYRNQSVLSVAGYGQMRPIASNETSEGRATNRRIDLRIIMYTPSSGDEIGVLQERLQSPGPAEKSK